jgi:O-acetylhomoserine (thiol)-lyase
MGNQTEWAKKRNRTPHGRKCGGSGHDRFVIFLRMKTRQESFPVKRTRAVPVYIHKNKPAPAIKLAHDIHLLRAKWARAVVPDCDVGIGHRRTITPKPLTGIAARCRAFAFVRNVRFRFSAWSFSFAGVMERGTEIASEEKKMTQGFDTRAIHAGAAPDAAHGSRALAIHQTSSYVFNDVDHAARLFALQEFGQIYTRITNPTTDVLERRIADLEGGTAAVAMASGHAAQFSALHVLMAPGDHIVAARQLYGGSINQFTHAFKKFGWDVTFVDHDNMDAFRSAITPKTKAVFIESLANPSGIVTDIEKIAAVAHGAGLPLIVDNTMASPYLIRPIEWGADVVVHSLTKFIGGHGNSIGGIIVDSGRFDWGANPSRWPTLTEPLEFYGGLKVHDVFGAIGLGPGGAPVNISLAIAARVFTLRDLGAAISPFNAWAIEQGVQTLGLRMQRHCENAFGVASWLEKHPKVAWVNYAGLPGNASKALQEKYSPKGAGAVFTFGLKGGYDAGIKLVANLKLFSHLANIGDTKSLVIHPASTTHRQVAEDKKVAAGAGPDVVRLSVGIEDLPDIIADLDQALAGV